MLDQLLSLFEVVAITALGRGGKLLEVFVCLVR